MFSSLTVPAGDVRFESEKSMVLIQHLSYVAGGTVLVEQDLRHRLWVYGPWLMHMSKIALLIYNTDPYAQNVTLTVVSVYRCTVLAAKNNVQTLTESWHGHSWQWAALLTVGSTADCGQHCWLWAALLTVGSTADCGQHCWQWATLLTVGSTADCGQHCWQWAALLTVGRSQIFTSHILNEFTREY